MKKLLVAVLLIFTNTLLANDLSGLFLVEEKKDSKDSSIEFRLSTVVDKNLSDTNSIDIKYKKRTKLFYSYGAELKFNDNKISDEGKTLKNNLQSQGVTFDIIKPNLSIYGNLGISPFLGKLNFFNKSFYDFYINLNFGAGFTSYETNSAWDKSSTSSFYSEVEFETNINENFSANIGVRKTYDSLENEKSNDYSDVFIGIGYRF